MSLSSTRVGPSRVLSVVLNGLRRIRMVLSGQTKQAPIAHGTVAKRCWYCGKIANVGEVCEMNPYTDMVFRYPHMAKETILDRGYYV